MRLGAIAVLPAHEAVRALAEIREGLPSADAETLSALARDVPRRVAALSGEVSLAIAELANELVGHSLTLPEDFLSLDARLRTAWHRVAILAGDRSAFKTDDLVLLQTVLGWPTDVYPRRLIGRLATARDARLKSIAVGALRPAFDRLEIDGPFALELLVPLAKDEDENIRRGALERLGEPWLTGLTPAQERQREGVIRDAVAVEAAAALGLRRLLLEFIADGPGPGPARARALVALGPLAQPDDLAVAIELAEEDPLEFGPPARRFLLEAHRHGVFLREEHLASVLGLFDRHQDWTGEELVRVTYLARKALVPLIAELSPDDRRWIRRADILAKSLRTNAHVVLREVLGRTADLEIAAALIDAAAQSPEFQDATALEAWLDRLPQKVLPALPLKGGSTAKILDRAMDFFTPRPLRAQLVDAAHAIEPLATKKLHAQLGVRESGALDSKYLSSRDTSAAEFLKQDESTVPAIDALRIYCESGSLRYLPDVKRLFREVFRGYVKKALEGDFTIKRMLMPELEQLVFRFGRHVIQSGRHVRGWVETGPETGRDLVLLFLIEWLAEPDVSDPIRVALLEAAARHEPSGAYLRYVEPWWRRGDANVKRAAIEALVASGEGARGLELSLGRLVAETNDARILTPALAAVRTLRASWAEPIVRAALERREMAVKKEAAEALAEIGTGRSLVAIVGWLARHDNDSFRESLHKALRHAAGSSFIAVLVTELGQTEDLRSKELLWKALSGHLRLALALRLAKDDRFTDLIDACLDGRVTLADASPAQLLAQLHRAKLRKAEDKPDPTRELRLEGFSPAAAKRLVDAREPKYDSAILPIVRAALPDWLTWLKSETDDVRAVDLVLEAATASNSEHFPALLDLVPKASPDVAVAFIERCLGTAPAPLKLRAVALLREIPFSSNVGGRRRWHLLGRLGAVRTVRDLDRALDECKLRPSFATESASLLMEALSIAPFPDEKQVELVALNKQARDWYRTSDHAWVARVAAERPIDVILIPEPPEAPAKPPFKPASHADLEALLRTLNDKAQPISDRARAAERILDWPDAHQEALRAVLGAYLKDEIYVADRRHRAVLATILDASAKGPRAAALVPHLSEVHARTLIPAWIDAWAEEMLAHVSQDLLMPFVVDRVRKGQHSAARLLRREAKPSIAMERLIDFLLVESPHDAEHLIPAPPSEHAPNTSDPIDPIDGADLAALVAIIVMKDKEKGLVVRAVHALARLGEPAIEPLARASLDRRPQVRSAALRALRTVASKERTLETTADVLKMESRRDVVLSLLKSLGHGRHEATLPILLDRVVDTDIRVREAARDALRAWGRDVVPALRHASKRVRPDRRKYYSELIADLLG